MAHQILISDDDYAALVAAAQERGAPIETLVHEAIAQNYATSTQPTSRGSYSLPTHTPIDPKLYAENERIAQSIGAKKPWASDIVSEDRGPR
ncbi:MAG: hypothetical protein ACLQUY_09205 [Ktedonobacterales bacterium]